MVDSKIREYVDSNFEALITTMNKEHLDLLSEYVFFPTDHRQAFISAFSSAVLAMNSTFVENDVVDTLDAFFKNKNFALKFDSILEKVLILDLSEFDDAVLDKAVITGRIWFYVGVSVKKCMGLKHCTTAVPPNFIVGNKNVVQNLVAGFNCNVSDYKRDDEPVLKLMLHHKFFDKKFRVQKKNISRVHKRVKRLFMLFIIRYRDSVAINGTARLLDVFVKEVKRKFY